MVNDNVCRCCLSEACFKDISNEYFNSENGEIYADMLLETFNINISYQGHSSRLICEECISRLKDAAAFRRQVLAVEETFTKNIFTEHFNNYINVKPTKREDDFLDHITGEFEDEDLEAAGDDLDDKSFGDDFHWDQDGSQHQHEDIKLQEQNDDNVFVIKVELEDDLPLQLLKQANGRSDRHNAKQAKLLKNKKEKIKVNKHENTIKAKLLEKIPQYDRKQNSLKLINNSNLCLFESLKTKFRCFYCENSYFNITDLREHSANHSNPSYLKMCINRMQGMSFKCVDISNLKCKNCSENSKDLVDLKSHLAREHGIQFTGEENMLIPYRLEKGFDCVMCEQNFNTFFKLSVHMNSHYSNHVCEICGVSYINRLSLRMHVNSRHKEKKCSYCLETFPNAYLRVKHMRKMHNTSESKRYCLICNKTFRYTYMLDEHKIQEHGMKRSISVCPECGKSFLSPVNLRTHIRCVHVKERNHACTHCGMCFFTSCDRRRHERTHQDLRSFSCSYCDGRFKSKDSLRRHLKRQHGHLYSNDAQTQHVQ